MYFLTLLESAIAKKVIYYLCCNFVEAAHIIILKIENTFVLCVVAFSDKPTEI